MSLITSSTLYLTSNSFGYLIFSVNNPNNVTLITNVMITSPPSPVNTYKPMIYFEPPNETLTLSPGTSTVKVYFFTNATVASGQGDIYLYNSPSTAITLGYNVIPAQIGILNATYYINGNYTVINAYVNNIGVIQSTLSGLTGAAYINYSTYTITTLGINITSPVIRLLPRITVLAPRWALVNVTITLSSPKTCSSFPVFYGGKFYVNNTYVGSVLVPCNSEGIAWNAMNITYRDYHVTLSITNTTITATINIIPPSINVVITCGI